MKPKALPKVSVSVVSHGQGSLVRHLLSDLEQVRDVDFEVILTVNVSEQLGYLDDLREIELRVVENKSPKGFGANHNAACLISRGDYFVVLNPDVRLHLFQFALLLEHLEQKDVGVCAPAIRSSDGNLQDSARRFPTFWRLLARRLPGRSTSDYSYQQEPMEVDWLAGMFLVFRRATFQEIGGFDERYFMYMEDVDLCRRMHEAGYSVLLDQRVQVVHDARRASRRHLRHFVWHLTGMLKYFLDWGKRSS